MIGSADHKDGRIELICGCMFSGKTERLIDRLLQAQRARITTAAFKHARDVRYSRHQLVSHGGRRAEARAVARAGEIPALAGAARLVVIDEAQFFEADLVEVCRLLAGRGREVIVAGLDRDSWGLPFGPIPDLAAVADQVIYTQAKCSVCGNPAEYTQRLAPIEGQPMIGGPESYEPRCAPCFQAPPIELRR